LWADVDRDLAAETRPMRRDEEVPAASDETTPLTVAELAAAGRDAPDEPGPDAGPDGDADRTLALPVGAVAAADAASPRAEVPAGASSPSAAPAEAATSVDPDAEPVEDTWSQTASTSVLEAIIDPGEVTERPRAGRWLVASILGAVTLAILFPLAIQALMRLVSLS
jgi:hypothetical protein